MQGEMPAVFRLHLPSVGLQGQRVGGASSCMWQQLARRKSAPPAGRTSSILQMESGRIEMVMLMEENLALLGF